MLLSDVAAALDARLIGDGTIGISRIVHPADAVAATDLALAMEKPLLALLPGGRAGAAVVLEGSDTSIDGIGGWIVVKRAASAMVVLTALFDPRRAPAPGIHPSAVVSPDAVIGEGVSIGAFADIGPGARIGAGTTILSHVTIGADTVIGRDGLIHPGVRVGDRVIIGDRAILHHNASIGADGFSFVTPEPGSVETAKATGRVGAVNTLIRRINSIGTVELGDDVEVGANSAIDRGTIRATRIGRGTKIDNLVQIAHNVVVGENCMICGQAGIAGSAEIGDRVVLAGGVGIADHVRIGHDSVVAARSGVGRDAPPRSVLMGYPAMPRDRLFSQIKNLHRLDRLFKDVARLKRLIGGDAADDPMAGDPVAGDPGDA